MAENKISFWKGTKAQYVNETHSDSVIYFVLDEFIIYVGNVEVSNNKIFFIEALAARYQDIIDRFSWGDDGGVTPPVGYDKDTTYLVFQVVDGDTLDLSRCMDEVISVDWGDGNVTADKIHTYTSSGVYDVAIKHAATSTFQFSGQDKLKEIKSVGTLTWHVFNGAFGSCINLDKIHPNALDNIGSAIRMANGSFLNNRSLKSLPNGIFDKFVNLEDVGYCFKDCVGLVSLPTGMFDNCKKMTNVSECFAGCEALNQAYNCTSEGLPTLWERDGSDSNSIVSMYMNFAMGANNTFRATVPKSWGGTLVTDTMSITKLVVTTPAPYQSVNFNYKIDGVISVDWGDGVKNEELSHQYESAGDYTVIIEHTETNNIDFSRVNEIKEVISVGKSQRNGMQYVFQNCANLEKIHAGAFDALTTVSGFSSCFAQCTKLKDVPANLFDKCNSATGFDSCFSGCRALASIPTGLFDKCPSATSFAYCFESCTNLDQEYNCTSEGQPKLWERAGVSGNGFASYSNPKFMASIPKSWGGSLTVKVDVKFSIVKDGAWLSSGDVRVNDIPCTIDENLVYTTSEKITGPYTITLDGETIHSGLIMDDFDVVLDTLIVGDTSSIMGGMDFSTMSEEDLTSHILYNDGWTLQTIDGVGRGLVSNQVEEFRSTRINFNTTMKGVKVNFNQSSLNPSSDYLRIGFDGNIEYNAWDIEGDKIVDVNRFNMLEYRRGPNSTNEGKRSNVLIHSISYPVLPPKP